MRKPAAVSRYPRIVPPVRPAARWAFLTRQEDRTQEPRRVLTLGTRAGRHARGDQRLQLHIIPLQSTTMQLLVPEAPQDVRCKGGVMLRIIPFSLHHTQPLSYLNGQCCRRCFRLSRADAPKIYWFALRSASHGLVVGSQGAVQRFPALVHADAGRDENVRTSHNGNSRKFVEGGE
jgi:hypothetical protein